jgi:MoaA/NifB/PqqE/SkfB family radical SAM enzyme
MTREKSLMNMELFQKIVDDAAREGIREVGLNFYNEPFADPLIFERISYVRHRGMKALLFSNGTLLTEDKANALLASGLDSVVFSFDGGTKEAYEGIRVGADFEKTKDHIVALIKERNRRGLEKPSILITFAAQRDNYHDIRAFRALWRGLADGVNVSEVDNRLVEGLLPDELKRHDRPKRLYPCRRLFNTVNVMSNGKVALCCRDFDGSVLLGDLNQQTIHEVYTSPKWVQLRQMHFNGGGDKMKLCREIQCPDIYRDGAYLWWVK